MNVKDVAEQMCGNGGESSFVGKKYCLRFRVAVDVNPYEYTRNMI